MEHIEASVLAARDLLDRLDAAFEDPNGVAQRCTSAGSKVVRYLGVDLPRELFLAAHVIPIRLAHRSTAVETPVGSPQLGARGAALVERISTAVEGELFAITHADYELTQLFANLRELESDPFARAWIEMIDLLHLPRESSLEYNRRRLLQLAERLHELTGRQVQSSDLCSAIALCNEQKRALEELDAARIACRIRGSHILAAIGAASVLPPQEHIAIVQELLKHVHVLPKRDGMRVFLAGSSHEDVTIYAALEEVGATIVGESHDTGQRWHAERVDQSSDPWLALAQPSLRAPLAMRSSRDSLQTLQLAIKACAAQAVVHIARAGDDAAAWEAAQCERDCVDLGVPCLRLELSRGDLGFVRETVARFLAAPRQTIRSATRHTAPVERAAAVTPRRDAGARSRKSLAAVADFGRYQREWFASIRRRVAAGEPFAIANANAPQEILRAFDVPFVVNQWWASIVAAKQQSARYLELLRERGFPTTVEAYSAQGLAACLDNDPQNAPWGGLPQPSLLVAVTSSDATLKIFEAWAQVSGAHLTLFERSVDCRHRISPRWWDELPSDWDRALEPERLDLMEDELKQHIGQLERLLGRAFPEARFAQVMSLVNEQEEWYRRTRDLIARSESAPVSIVDTMPATMVPQWHRGTEWARDAARAFHDEVAARVARGESACPNERLRLMWVGRGLWSEMGFYQKWERSHGAVFVWSMYLALAADGYVRTFDRGRDPLRALAARFVTMGDELRMPTWGGAWHVHEAQTHRIDGAVALADADPFVVRALQAAGFPVLMLPLDNFSEDAAGRARAEQSITEFIEARSE